jgi:uncharacterized protein YndB with AHSA1/START domain
VKILKILFILIAVAILVVLGLAMRQPDIFVVQRTATLPAPAEKVYAVLEDFRRWPEWSPFERDPAMKRTISEPGKGKGATYAWEGNSDVGAGRMEITEATPPSKLVLKLDFIKPFATSNVVEYTLVPKGNATDVTWSMRGPMPFISKVICVFVDMDKMVGKDFEAGLAKLGTVAAK